MTTTALQHDVAEATKPSVRIILPTEIQLSSTEQSQITEVISQLLRARGIPSEQIAFTKWSSVVDEVLSAEEDAFLTKVEQPLGLGGNPLPTHRS